MTTTSSLTSAAAHITSTEAFGVTGSQSNTTDTIQPDGYDYGLGSQFTEISSISILPAVFTVLKPVFTLITHATQRKENCLHYYNIITQRTQRKQ